MDYPELVLEAALRSGAPEIPARAVHFVTQAERDLEKVLRVRQMEAMATLTADADGKATLPADFLAARTDGKRSWPVSGDDILARPDETFDLTYYAKLPSVVTNGTNWLLDLEPEIYVQAVLAQIYAAMSDERLIPTGQVLAERVRAFIREDRIARFGAQKIDISGVAR